jgi:hypothetical protein
MLLGEARTRSSDVSDQHPTVPTWTPEAPPPPPRRRFGPGLVAGLIAVVVAFGGVGLFAARQVAGTTDGAASPEAAAAGLLTALGSQDLDRAAGYLEAQERLLLATYGDRITGLLARGVAGPGGQASSGIQLTARDIRFRRVAGVGGDNVAVVELADGTLGGRDARGAKLELPVEELNRRLIDQTKGAVHAVAAVAVRDGDRWRVSLLASAAEHARQAAGAAEPDWDQLAAGLPDPAGAASPEAAVRDLVAAAEHGQLTAVERLAPAECRVLTAYRSLLAGGSGTAPKRAVRVEGLETRTEQVSGEVARVHATAGRLVGAMFDEAIDLRQAGGAGEAPYVVAIRQGGTWYPSLEFTTVDWMLNQAERERP